MTEDEKRYFYRTGKNDSVWLYRQKRYNQLPCSENQTAARRRDEEFL